VAAYEAGDPGRRLVRRCLLGACTALAAGLSLLTASAPAFAQTHPAVDAPGPALSVPQAQLDAALECSEDLAAVTGQEPVLLVPGTSLTPDANFDWNWMPALDTLGWAWCSVELPGSALGDVQVAGEYVVNAIRTMEADYGDPIDVLGYSQGGMLPRWALRFWPDTRPLVDDLVGIAPSNHGTTNPQIAFCPVVGCAPALWQQGSASGFIAALNSHQETFAGIDYTAIYTTQDTTVTPNSDDDGSSSLRPGDSATVTNVSIQEVCPGLPAMPNQSHELVFGGNPAYLLAVNALQNPGPAGDSALTEAECTAFAMPGVNLATAATDLGAMTAHSNQALASHPKVFSEPFVACYAVTPCGPPPSGGSSGGSSTAQPGTTGRRAKAIAKCKRKKGKARAKCLKKAKKLPV
jgi:triacylglycerol esterase/lipase EstA (alpha/beta hydrolase family)